MKFLGKVFLALMLIVCGICFVKLGLFDKFVSVVSGFFSK